MKIVIEKLINQAVQNLIAEKVLPADINIRIQVERTRDKAHGHFACNIALMLAKQAGIAPRELAAAIQAQLPSDQRITKVDIAGPGFLNFTLNENTLNDIIKTVLTEGDAFGKSKTGNGQRIHMEYVSANPTGPLHVGHGRSAAYGACVNNLLKAVGYDVHADYYVNDAGRQMRILALSTWFRYLELLGEPIDLPPNAYQGDYIIDVAKFLLEKHGEKYRTACPSITAEDKEEHIDKLVIAMQEQIGETGFELFRITTLEHILADIKDDLEEFGVTYDNWFHESKLFKDGLLEQGIERLKSQGYVFEKEGAVWFRATEFGDEKDRVLLRANGQPTYFASDVAYHLYKYEQGYDRIIDIFGADHHGYIARIKAFLKGLGKDPEKLDVLLVQFAILYRGKQKVSMSTRSGEFVTLRDLRKEVGNDAARYFYIMRKPEQHLDFDLELAKSQSNDNPVYYIQYAHARICSVWNQLKKANLHWEKNRGLSHLDQLSEENEKTLINTLTQYPELILTAAKHREPHVLANFLQNLANTFHSYYNSSRFIVDDETLRDARLCLIAAVQQVIKNGLLLLGLSAPDSM